jgi:hypothetical protein
LACCAASHNIARNPSQISNASRRSDFGFTRPAFCLTSFASTTIGSILGEVKTRETHEA